MKVPVLMYHKVAPLNPAAKIPAHYVEPRLFERQMKLLRTLKFQVVPLENMFDEVGRERRIALTFDDGYENFFTYALPILNELDYPSTVFLVSNLIGKTNLWDVREGDAEERLMDRSQIVEASERSVSFGSHTQDHVDLGSSDATTARTQIRGSKLDLESNLGISISTFCYPYGRKTLESEAIVATAGYTIACSTEKGVNTRDTNPMSLKRINVRRETSPPLFLYKIWRSLVLGK